MKIQGELRDFQETYRRNIFKRSAKTKRGGRLLEMLHTGVQCEDSDGVENNRQN